MSQRLGTIEWSRIPVGERVTAEFIDSCRSNSYWGTRPDAEFEAWKDRILNGRGCEAAAYWLRIGLYHRCGKPPRPGERFCSAHAKRLPPPLRFGQVGAFLFRLLQQRPRGDPERAARRVEMAGFE